VKIAFLGLGVMGFPMAAHLVQAGHSVKVYNRTLAKAQRWVDEHSGSYAETPKQAAQNAELVVLCLGNDQSVEEAILGAEGVLQCLTAGAIIIDHTTTSSTLARQMAEACQQQGVYFLDAPVSGGEAGAINGQLTSMVGGQETAYQRASSVLDAYTQRHRYFGGSGKGQEAKMVNQTLIAGVLQGLSEGLLLAEKCGLEVSLLAETLSKGAAQSWQLDNRAVTMSEGRFDFGFAIDHMIKDLGIVREQAERVQLRLPLVEQVLSRYQTLAELGDGRSDTSVLIKSLILEQGSN
jgi:3-hydroxyisobutyrate dehydrogenase